MKGGGLCPDLSFPHQGTEFTPYTWGSDGGVASMFGDSRCGFFIEVGEPAQGDTPRNDYFINIKNDSKLGGVPQIEQITEQTTKLEGTKKIELSQLQLNMEKNPITNLDNYFADKKQPYSVIQLQKDGKMTRFELPKAPTPTVVEDESTKTTTDVEGDRFTIKQDIEKVTHKGVEVLKTVGPVKLFDKNDKEVDKMEGEEEKTEEVGEIVNKGNVAKVLCLPISTKLGSAEDTKELFNLSDNSRRLAEITKEDEGLKTTRGTDHLKNKMYELHRSLDVLFMKIDGETSKINSKRSSDKVIGNTGNNEVFKLVLDIDTSLRDSINNYRVIFDNLNTADTPQGTLDDFKKQLLNIDILKGIVEDLKSKIFLNLNDPKESLPDLNKPLEGEKLYKFCSAIQIKIVALTTLLGKVTSLKKDDEGQLIVVEKNGEKELSDSVLNERERTKHYFIASKLNFSGSMKDLSVKERASDLARNTSILRRNIRQGVENTSIQGIGKGIGKAASKGVGKAKGFMSYFTNTQKKQPAASAAAPAAATEGPVPANATVGGKRKTRKNKARKTRRKVQRKRRQSKKH